MKRDRQVVGFDRTIELSWMDATAGFVADGLATAEVRRRLFAYLEGIVPGNNPHTQRGKTITVLTRIWSRVAPEAEGIRDAALKLYGDVSPETRLALHWAMALAGYPFFLDTAAIVGRLFRLHAGTTLQQVTRRLEEGWGARPSIYRSAHRVLQTMERWGVICTGERAGHYKPAPRKLTPEIRCGAILAEALLLGQRGGAAAASDLSSHPALFPFEIRLDAGELRRADRLEVHRVGLDVDQVSLRADCRA